MIYKEGSAEINQQEGVFLNPNMSKLRDISVLFLSAVAPKNATLLDATAASGIRGIRYAKEVGIKKITLIDINEKAARSASSNVKRHKLNLKILNKSVQEFANVGKENFDIIDLDPFGSPAPYLNDLMKIINADGHLLVTATDTAVLCGAHEHACMKIYHAKPLHNILCKEAGIRILISHIARVAASFNYGIDVKLSISDLHYMRVFIKLNAGAKNALDSMKKMGFCAYCSKCNGFSFAQGIAPFISRECIYCGADVQLGGPMWLGNLKDEEIIKKMLNLSKKSKVSEEAKIQLDKISNELDMPMFYSIPRATRTLGIGSLPHKLILKNLESAGFKVSLTQFERDCIKTDAKSSDLLKAIKSAAKSLPK